MDDDWWPSVLAHIPKEDPFGEDMVLVSEVRSLGGAKDFDTRICHVALVPLDQFVLIESDLVGIHHEPTTNGPHPFYDSDSGFEPKFWVGHSRVADVKFEPLVVSWRSGSRTVLCIDQGFLMTYGLVPRNIEGGPTVWDDPQEPRPDVAFVSPPSVYDFPFESGSEVRISREYLQDYLTLRNMVLVQTYFERRDCEISQELSEFLSGTENKEERFYDRLIQVGLTYPARQEGFVQVWGARVLAFPGGLPISEDKVDAQGISWPGFEELITTKIALALKPTDYVYVKDVVLGAYEGRREFQINPRLGSVRHGGQWSVSYCARVGRDLIKLELKKLYEGNRESVIRHWHRHAVEPPKEESKLDRRNVAIRTEELVNAILRLGDALVAFGKAVGIAGPSAKDYVGLDRGQIEYSGWWTSPGPEHISRHIPIDLTADGFVDRCLELVKVVVENLSERNLRKIHNAIKAPTKEIQQFRTLKLLSSLVSMAMVASKTGLSLAADGEEIWARVKEEDEAIVRPIEQYFALYDIRILKGHDSSKFLKEIERNLQRFDVRPGEESAGYGIILDRVYDALIQQTNDIAETLVSVSIYE